LRTKLLRDDFNFLLLNFPNICSSSPAEFASLSW